MLSSLLLFFFHHSATTEIYTLSLHDALPISQVLRERVVVHRHQQVDPCVVRELRRLAVVHVPDDAGVEDRKSTRLNSSHANISYAVFCLKKKKRRSR